MGAKSRTAAFFDLDNTIIVGTNSLYLYVKYMVRRKMMSRWELARGLWLSFLHKLNLVDIERLLDEFVLPYRGLAESDIIALTKDWFESHVIPNIAREAVARVRWHKNKGHETVLLSTASQYVCRPIKSHLKLDETINSIVEVRDGRFTGYFKKPLCYHDGKVHYTREYAQKKGLDLKKSYFYTDSISDLPMLEEIGHPVAVNPDPLLAREAKKRGWPIEAWSKGRVKGSRLES